MLCVEFELEIFGVMYFPQSFSFCFVLCQIIFWKMFKCLYSITSPCFTYVNHLCLLSDLSNFVVLFGLTNFYYMI